MKHNKLITIYILFIITLTTQALSANAPSYSSIKNAIDTASTVLGTQLPGGNMASALSAVPSTTRAILTLNPNTIMQSLAIEEMNHPERQDEIYSLINRYQAIRSAINGDPSHWNTLNSNQNKNNTINQNSNTQPVSSSINPAEEESNMNDHLSLLHKRLAELQANTSSIEQQMNSNILRITSVINTTRQTADMLKIDSSITEIKRIDELHHSLNNIFNELFKIKYNLKNSYSQIVNLINLAKARKRICKDSQDSSFISNSYAQAKSLLKDAEASYNKALTLSGKFQQLKAELDSEYAAARNARQNALDDYNNRIRDFVITLQNLENDIDSLKHSITKNCQNLTTKTETLKTDITESKNYYTPLFPNSENTYNTLLSRTYILLANIDRIKADIGGISSKFKNNIIKLKDKSPDEPVNITTKESETIINEIDSLFTEIQNLIDSLRQIINANSNLNNGCSSKNIQDNTKSNTSNDSQTTNSQEPQNDLTPSTQTENILIFGGLTICGPTVLKQGQRVTYIACDAEGKPYTSTEEFKWYSSRDNLLSLGDSSNAVNAVGFKKGKLFIMLKHEGLNAFLDIEIKPEITNDSNTKDSLFNSKGGRQDNATNKSDDDCDSCDDKTDENDNSTTTDINSKCNSILNQLVNAINSGKPHKALALRNSAIIEGCNIDVEVVNNYINQLITMNNTAVIREQQHSINQQNILLLQNILNNLNQINNTKKPHNHSHNNSNESKTSDFEKIKNFGNASKQGSW